MEILEYDEVDPDEVLRINLMSLDYALTPERVALIRKLDARPFPCFAIYAIEEGVVAGQAGLYRLPMVTTEGPEEVGGVGAVCTHPAFSRGGIAGRLLEAAHERMRAAGLRFSTLGTARHRAAHALYRRCGYEDVFGATAVFARAEIARRPTRFRAQRAGPSRLHMTEALFRNAAGGYLGFSRRHPSFIPMLVATGDLDVEDLWLLWNLEEPAGYAVARKDESILTIRHLLLAKGIDAAAAVAAIAQPASITHLKLRLDQASMAAELSLGGYPAAMPDWSTFMVKPLRSEVTIEDARRLFGVGTNHFLISPLDVT